MQSIESCRKDADRLARDVVNVWGFSWQAGSKLRPEFGDLVERACQYEDAKEIARNHREFGMLSEHDVARQEATRNAFADAYKEFWEKNQFAD
jgi:hypothetical protein